MAYRDELEAAQARARALELELADARAEVAALKDQRRARAMVRRPTAGLEVSARTRRSAWLNGPKQLILSRRVAGSVPESAYPRLVEQMRDAIGTIGQVSTFARSLAWASSPQQGCPRVVELTVDVGDEETTIRITERLSLLAGRVFGGGLGGVGGGGLMLPVAIGIAAPALIPLAVAVWLGGTYAVCRRIYQGKAERLAEQLAELLDRLSSIAAEAIARQQEAEALEEEMAQPQPQRRAASEGS